MMVQNKHLIVIYKEIDLFVIEKIVIKTRLSRDIFLMIIGFVENIFNICIINSFPLPIAFLFISELFRFGHRFYIVLFY